MRRQNSWVRMRRAYCTASAQAFCGFWNWYFVLQFFSGISKWSPYIFLGWTYCFSWQFKKPGFEQPLVMKGGFRQPLPIWEGFGKPSDKVPRKLCPLAREKITAFGQVWSRCCNHLEDLPNGCQITIAYGEYARTLHLGIQIAFLNCDRVVNKICKMTLSIKNQWRIFQRLIIVEISFSLKNIYKYPTMQLWS